MLGLLDPPHPSLLLVEKGVQASSLSSGERSGARNGEGQFEAQMAVSGICTRSNR